MARIPEKIEAEDRQFWSSVQEVIFLLLPNEVPVIRFEYNLVQDLCPTKPTQGMAQRVQYRLVCRALDTGFVELNGLLYEIYYFFSSSPDFFILIKKSVCNMNIPLAYSEKELLHQFLTFFLKTSYGEYAAALCRAAMHYFRQGDDLLWSKDAVQTYEHSNLATSALRHSITVLYTNWRKYIQQHYDRRLLGVDRPSKSRAIIKRLEGIRNQKVPTLAPLNIGLLFQRFMLFDDTLVVQGINGFECVSIEAVQRTMADFAFSASTYRDFVYLLQQYQKSKCAVRRFSRKRKKADFSIAVKTEHWLYQIDMVDGMLHGKDPDSEESLYKGKLVVKAQSKDDFQAAKEALYELTNGSSEQLCTFAKCLLCCFSTEKAYEGAILLPSNNSERVIQLLSLAMQGNILSRPLSELSEVTCANVLIEHKLHKNAIIMSRDDGSRLSKEKWERLSKLIRGKRVTYSDPILGRKIHYNTAQWIIVGNDETAKQLRKHNIPFIYFSPSVVKKLSILSNSPWFKLILPFWAMLPNTALSSVGKDDIPLSVKDFVESRCALLKTDGDFVQARTAYDAYKQFCFDQNYEGVVLFKEFNDCMETKYGLKRTRKHSKTSSNLTGYKRLQLMEKAEQPLIENEKNKQSFYRKLDQILQEVLDHSPDFPWKDELNLPF